jgi:prostamide/prostaglandin F2alpha synthase
VLDADERDRIASAESLADIVLPDHEGREIRLGDLWRERPVALVWLRHYG